MFDSKSTLTGEDWTSAQFLQDFHYPYMVQAHIYYKDMHYHLEYNYLGTFLSKIEIRGNFLILLHQELTLEIEWTHPKFLFCITYCLHLKFKSTKIRTGKTNEYIFEMFELYTNGILFYYFSLFWYFPYQSQTNSFLPEWNRISVCLNRIQDDLLACQ